MNDSTIPTLSAGEAALEKELRSYAPLPASTGLKDRIRQIEPEVEPPLVVEEAEETEVIPFPPQWMSVAAAFVVVGLSIALVFGIASRNGTTNPQSGLAAGDAGEGPLIWEETPASLYPNLSDVISDPNRVLVGQRNDGVFRTEDGQPMWKVRYYIMHVQEVVDAETGEVREEFVPEERILMVPVTHD